MKEEMINKLRQECISSVGEKYRNEEKVVVFGEGNLKAKIVLVGEAPGEKETKYIKPFVGKAGKNLDQFLKILELEREDIYITNIVKIRPFKINAKNGRLSNRPPNKNEINMFLPFILGELKIIEPHIVVTLGNTSLRAITRDNKISIGDCHGMPIKKDRFYIFPLYHPASIIYNVKLEETYERDLIRLKEFVLIDSKSDTI